MKPYFFVNMHQKFSREYASGQDIHCEKKNIKEGGGAHDNVAEMFSGASHEFISTQNARMNLVEAKKKLFNYPSKKDDVSFEPVNVDCKNKNTMNEGCKFKDRYINNILQNFGENNTKPKCAESEYDTYIIENYMEDVRQNNIIDKESETEGYSKVVCNRNVEIPFFNKNLKLEKSKDTELYSEETFFVFLSESQGGNKIVMRFYDEYLNEYPQIFIYSFKRDNYPERIEVPFANVRKKTVIYYDVFGVALGEKYFSGKFVLLPLNFAGNLDMGFICMSNKSFIADYNDNESSNEKK